MSDTKKELGQHWLEDAGILEAIVAAADITSDDYVLEIGPGKGTLTQVLAEKAGHVHALEFDMDLIAGLQKTFTAHTPDKVTIVQGDVRTFDFGELPKQYKIVANIPYYLTSHLIRSISETGNPPQIAALLVQKEVAQRIAAQPGQMSILAVTAQFYFECSLGVAVPAAYFTPPPKVDSQVVVLQRRSEKLFAVDEASFFQLVKAGFSERRKTLRNALSGGLRISKEEVETLLDSANVAATTRAQELSLHDWQAIHLALNPES